MMEKQQLNDERLAELIRTALPRREAPVGLETRIMAQVVLRDRQRRERRAMACYCLGTAAAMAVVVFACLRSVDSPEGLLQVLAILAGVVAAMIIACGDRATEILRRL